MGEKMTEFSREQNPSPEGFVTVTDFNALKSDFDELKSQLAELIATNNRLAEQLEEKKSEIADLRQELNDLKRANGMPVDDDTESQNDTPTEEYEEEDDFEVFVRNRNNRSNQPTAAHNINQDSNRNRRKSKGWRSATKLGAVALTALAIFGGAKLIGNDGTESVKADTSAQTTQSTNNANTVNGSAANMDPKDKAQLIKNLQGVISIGGASKVIKSDSNNIKNNIAAIFDSNEKIKLNHNKGAMSSVLREYAPGQIDPINAAEVTALSAESSDSYAAGLYNAMHNRHVEASLPKGVTVAQARDYIERVMTANGTKFSIEKPHGIFENHGMRGEHRFSAGDFNANGTITMFVITDANGHKTYIKTSNECFNILNKFVGQRQYLAPTQGGANVPSVVPSGPTTHPRPKHDPNHTPAGVPGEPRGSGGNGPEPSRPHAGKAPSSVYQPQAPKPTRVPNTGHSTQPAETGVDRGTNGPATKGNGTDQPAGKINSGNVPLGD